MYMWIEFGEMVSTRETIGGYFMVIFAEIPL
jgi:hypothetical protein